MVPNAPPRVLLVEDELPLARLYMRALVAAGYEVDHAPEGEVGLRMLHSQSYDVVLSDVCMPNMGGMDLLTEIRRRWPEISVVMMSAFLDAEAYGRAREMGTVRYLIKPVSLEKLANAVDSAVKIRAALLRAKDRKTRGAAL